MLTSFNKDLTVTNKMKINNKVCNVNSIGDEFNCYTQNHNVTQILMYQQRIYLYTCKCMAICPCARGINQTTQNKITKS